MIEVYRGVMPLRDRLEVAFANTDATHARLHQALTPAAEAVIEAAE